MQTPPTTDYPTCLFVGAAACSRLLIVGSWMKEILIDIGRAQGLRCPSCHPVFPKPERTLSEVILLRKCRGLLGEEELAWELCPRKEH